MPFLRTITAIIINSICLKCSSADTVAEFQHRWFSLQSHNEITRPRFPYILLTTNFQIQWSAKQHAYWLFQTKPKSEKPFTSPSILFGGKRLASFSRAAKKNSLCGSIHHYMTEGRGAEYTMWDSILSPRQLLFTLGAFFFLWLPCCSVAPVSPRLPCETSSVFASHGSPACAEGGGRGALKLHCRKAF